jgi:transcriptional regulator with XRE-family HTH domain
MNVRRINALVNASKLNKVQIAEMGGFTRTTLDNLLSGADVKVSTVESLAKVLNVSVAEFFADEDELSNKVAQSEVERLKGEIEKLNEQLKKRMSTKVVVELDVDSDEFVKMGLKDKVIRILNR